MSKLSTFTHPVLGTLRAVLIDGKTWFIASDVCKTLHHSNTSQTIAFLDGSERSKYALTYYREVNTISERGLYSIINKSKNPHANLLKDWIESDVIPNIRKLPICPIVCKPDITTPMNSVIHQSFTIDQYLRAAEIIAGCMAERMDEVRGILKQAGFSF